MIERFNESVFRWLGIMEKIENSKIANKVNKVY